MSNTQNTVWLENAQENFEEALQERDWSTARAILSDIEDAGFDSERKLRREMNRVMSKPESIGDIMASITRMNEKLGEMLTSNNTQHEVY